MSTEISVKYASVEKILKETLNASQDVNTSFSAPEKGETHLNSLDTCESVITDLSIEIQKYTEVLHTHVNQTQLMINRLKQEDEKIASSIMNGVQI